MYLLVSSLCFKIPSPIWPSFTTSNQFPTPPCTLFLRQKLWFFFLCLFVFVLSVCAAKVSMRQQLWIAKENPLDLESEDLGSGPTSCVTKASHKTSLILGLFDYELFIMGLLTGLL